MLALEWDEPHTFEFAVSPGSSTPHGAWLALTVRDSGVGIEPDEQERVWSEFYQVDSSATRQYGGTGLGLAIVKRLTLLMGGNVAVASAPGRGSTFTIWLPFQAPTSYSADPVPDGGTAQAMEETTSWSVRQS